MYIFVLKNERVPERGEKLDLSSALNMISLCPGMPIVRPHAGQEIDKPDIDSG